MEVFGVQRASLKLKVKCSEGFWVLCIVLVFWGTLHGDVGVCQDLYILFGLDFVLCRVVLVLFGVRYSAGGSVGRFCVFVLLGYRCSHCDFIVFVLTKILQDCQFRVHGVESLIRRQRHPHDATHTLTYHCLHFFAAS